LKDDRTAVFVDARAPEKFKAETIPGAVNVQLGETNGQGTRIVIFGDSAEVARAVATEVAEAAYWNSSYFGGTYEDIRRARLW
jgi:rhodanese-related sulfurtransferase